jgi:hypothetical protein
MSTRNGGYCIKVSDVNALLEGKDAIHQRSHVIKRLKFTEEEALW